MTIAAHRTGAPEASGAADVIEVRFSAIGTTAALAVADPAAASAAETMLRADLAELDRVCSRFRADSEIRQLERTVGSPVTVSPLLAEIVDTALRAAQLTDGLVDPTVGIPMVSLGYDRDFAALDVDGPAIVPVPAPGWWRISWDPRSREILLPHGISLDVGPPPKPSRPTERQRGSARSCAAGYWSTWVVTSPSPAHLRRAVGGCSSATTTPTPTLTAATMSRSSPAPWQPPEPPGANGAAAGRMHHILDPRTGAPAAGGWRTVIVAAASCVDANTASTTSIVLGAAAPGWLTAHGLPARLVTDDGAVHTVAGWPATAPAGMGVL